MSGKSERKAAREAVAAYHEARLSELVLQVAKTIDRFRNGELDAFEVDQVFFQYSRAAKELWKFCNITDPETAVELARKQPFIDWWEQGTPTRYEGRRCSRPCGYSTSTAAVTLPRLSGASETAAVAEQRARCRVRRTTVTECQSSRSLTILT